MIALRKTVGVIAKVNYRKRLLDYIECNPGLSDRQLADFLEESDSRQQRVNAETRHLASQGKIVRRKRSDGILGNFPAPAAVSNPTYNVEAKSGPPSVKASTHQASDAHAAVPECPQDLPSNIEKSVRRLGQLWRVSPACPRFEQSIVEAWDKLLLQWRNDNSLPLLVRKASAVRGAELIHPATGRAIVPTDNSPAQWSCSRAPENRSDLL